jgi:hypothetical protein
MDLHLISYDIFSEIIKGSKSQDQEDSVFVKGMQKIGCFLLDRIESASNDLLEK